MDSKTAYRKTRIEAKKKLEEINRALKLHENKLIKSGGEPNWAHVGDIGRVCELLDDIKRFLNYGH